MRRFLFNMPFYAVAKGKSPGIYNTWDECKANVTGFSGAIFKKFSTKAECQTFIDEKTSGGTTNGSTNRSFSTFKPVIPPVSLQNDITKKKYSNKRTISIPLPDSGSIKRQKTENLTKVQFGKYEFLQDENGFVQVYTDGSCVNNGKVGARAGLGVYFDENHPLNLSEPVSGRPTNNCGEIQASSKAIQMAKQNGVKQLCINTDSQFLINSITKWIHGWKKKNWKLAGGDDVKNRVDFQELDKLLEDKTIKIKWNYVKAHCGILGNERADDLAKEGAARYKRKY